MTTQAQELETTNGAATAAQAPLVKPGNSIDRRKPKVVSSTERAIGELLQGGRLVVPPDYSVENALAAAWLTLQEVQDMNKRPALEVCTDVSVQNALFDMAVQGLNPSKKQCYFIVYGKSLTCQRSYFGDIALAKRVRPGIEIEASVVYEGDTFKFGIKGGKKIVEEHLQTLESIEGGKIRAAYATVTNEDGEIERTEVMTIEQIKNSWKQSKTYKPDGNGTHQKFEAEMCLRTVYRKVCKPIINASNDACLAMALRRQDELQAEAEFSDELEANANQTTVRFADEDVMDVEATEREAEPVDPIDAEEGGQTVIPEADEPF